MMELTLRRNLDRPLTTQEMDDNFLYILGFTGGSASFNVSVNNGLNNDSGAIRLGGSLLEDTTIGLSANQIYIQNPYTGYGTKFFPSGNVGFGVAPMQGDLGFTLNIFNPGNSGYLNAGQFQISSDNNPYTYYTPAATDSSYVIPNTQWVKNAIGSSATIGSNGLTNSPGLIQLGGVLSTNTSIFLGTQQFNINGSNSGVQFEMIDDTTQGWINLSADYFGNTFGIVWSGDLSTISAPYQPSTLSFGRFIDAGDSNSGNPEFTNIWVTTGFAGSSLIVQDDTASIGLQYWADYSLTGSINPRWIPDVAYVSRLINGLSAQAVFSISATSSNGVSATVSGTTSHPVLSLSLGDITPASLQTAGRISTSFSPTASNDVVRLIDITTLAKTVIKEINAIGVNEVSFYMRNSGNIISVISPGATAVFFKTGVTGTYPETQSYPRAYTAGDRVFASFTYVDLLNNSCNLVINCLDN